MGTRSIIAVPHGDGWRGRYCHWDGYPQGVGVNLLAIVQRDGIEQARTILTQDFYGWSGINRAQPHLDGVVPDKDADYGSPAYVAWLYSPEGHLSRGRFVNVPGYGEAYNPLPMILQDGSVYREASRDQWITDVGLDGTDCEWLYVMHDMSLRVYQIGHVGGCGLLFYGSFEYGVV